ncbi:MAG: hypothetical protein UT64_C0071G0001, partial [Candidatus Falkowbacteria bacterium GW2011_GWF2_39_8]
MSTSLRGVRFQGPEVLARFLGQRTACFVFQDGAELMVVSDVVDCLSLDKASATCLDGMKIFAVIRNDNKVGCEGCDK